MATGKVHIETYVMKNHMNASSELETKYNKLLEDYHSVKIIHFTPPMFPYDGVVWFECELNTNN